MLTIHNVRLGHANNSSSSHSVVLVPPERLSDDDDLDGEYGWGNFTLASAGAKARYLAVQVRDVLGTMFPDDVVAVVMRELYGLPVPPQDAYVDHQSAWALPVDYLEPRQLDGEFLDALQDFLAREDVAILGGNDNSDGHPLAEQYPAADFPLGSYGSPSLAGQLVARRDTRLGYWTLFNRGTGAKVRLSFDERGTTDLSGTRASAPELVDLKITDFCPVECVFCYQGSGRKGGHADTAAVYQALAVLGGLRVFEAAIGGGEPTLHPSFSHILHETRARGIVPNFTTRRTEWMRDRAVVDTMGSFAYSTERAAAVHYLAGEMAEHGITPDRASVQAVPALLEDGQMEEILHACALHKLRLTLLGYKAVGRAAEDPSALARERLNLGLALEENRRTYVRTAVDTVLAARAGDLLKRAGVSRYLYAVKDGLSSWYVDAVARMSGPSSYEPEALRPWASASQLRGQLEL
jgi:hypothetical protein